MSTLSPQQVLFLNVCDLEVLLTQTLTTVSRVKEYVRMHDDASIIIPDESLAQAKQAVQMNLDQLMAYLDGTLVTEVITSA